MAGEKPKITASTQEHLDIEDITEDLIVFKTGWVGMVMSISSVNFDLLSEAEQDASIYAYGAFLNSLTFPVQILIRTRKADVSAYFAHLEEAENSQQNPDLKGQIQKYKEFIKSIISQKTVLDKKFYMIINYSPLEKGIKGFSKPNISKAKGKMQLLADAKVLLTPKRDHIIKQMGRIGLAVRQLTTKELVELFYDIYNPAPTGTQRVILDTSSYTTPVVEPAVAIPTQPPVVNSPDANSAKGQTATSLPAAATQPTPTQPRSASAAKPTTQQAALKNLQTASAKAAQFIAQNKQGAKTAKNTNLVQTNNGEKNQ